MADIVGTGIDPLGGGVNPGSAELGGLGGGGLSGLLSSNQFLSGIGGIAAGGIGALLASQSSAVPFSANAQSLIGTAGAGSATLGAEGQTLLNPLISGQLPQGAQAEVQDALNQMKNQTKAKYASLGMTGSTAEQTDLGNIDLKGEALTFQIAQQMASTGIQATQLSTQQLQIESTALSNLMQAQMQQNKQTSSSISNFMGAIAGGLAKSLPAILAA